MSSAFKLYPDGEPAAAGAFGVSAFGTAPFGGNQQGTVLVLPENEVGGDDTTRSLSWHVAETEHRRDGALLGARKYDDWRSWRFVYTALDVAAVEAFLVFFRARRFKFIPDASNEEQFVPVHWVGREFHPRSNRDGNYGLEFEVEEVD